MNASPPAIPTTLPEAAYDEGFAPVGRRIGLIALSTDLVAERAFGSIVERGGANYFTTRIRYIPSSELAGSHDEEEQDIARAAAVLLPEAGIDVLAFCCTSRSAENGERETIDFLEKLRPGIACTTPLTAAAEALRALGIRRLGLVSPYLLVGHNAVQRALGDLGFEVVRSACFNLALGSQFARLTTAAIADAARSVAAGGGIDGIFISCAGIRSIPAIETLERETGLPVVTSAQTMAWHSLRLLGQPSAPEQPGSLFLVA